MFKFLKRKREKTERWLPLNGEADFENKVLICYLKDPERTVSEILKHQRNDPLITCVPHEEDVLFAIARSFIHLSERINEDAVKLVKKEAQNISVSSTRQYRM